MTIAHEASTGVESSSTAKGTTSTNVAYGGVAAGRRALLFASAKPSTVTWPAITGWTNIVDLAGGTGVENTADDAPTRLGVWYRDLDGSESGSVTITPTGSPNCVVGAMSTYSTTTSWDGAPAAVTGDDATHGASYSAAAGAWAATLAAGDLVAVGRASDNDNTGAKSNFALTQTGASFSGLAYRNNQLNSSGSDVCVVSTDCAVTTGSANAPTFSHDHAGGAQSCGAFAAVRLRDTAGTHIRLTAPATVHDQQGESGNRDALKLVQPVAGNWDVSVRFSDLPSQAGEGWGFYVDGGTGTGWLRAGMLLDTAGVLRRYVSTTDTEDGAATVHADTPFPARYFSGVGYLRLVKSGTAWQFLHSANAVIWHQAASFTWAGVASRLGPMLAKTATASPSVVDVDWFRNTPAAGPITAVFPVDANGVGEAFQPASIDIAFFSSAYAQDPQIAIVTNGIEAAGTLVAAAAPAVSVAPAEATAGAVALNAVGDPSDLGNLYIDALGAGVAADPGPSVAVRPAAA